MKNRNKKKKGIQIVERMWIQRVKSKSTAVRKQIGGSTHRRYLLPHNKHPWHTHSFVYHQQTTFVNTTIPAHLRVSFTFVLMNFLWCKFFDVFVVQDLLWTRKGEKIVIENGVVRCKAYNGRNSPGGNGRRFVAGTLSLRDSIGLHFQIFWRKLVLLFLTNAQKCEYTFDLCSPIGCSLDNADVSVYIRDVRLYNDKILDIMSVFNQIIRNSKSRLKNKSEVNQADSEAVGFKQPGDRLLMTFTLYRCESNRSLLQRSRSDVWLPDSRTLLSLWWCSGRGSVSIQYLEYRWENFECPSNMYNKIYR